VYRLRLRTPQDIIGGCFFSLVTMKTVVITLLLISITRYELISASLGGVVVARQPYHQLANGNLPPVGTGKRWAPTEIRLNEFIHKIRSRFNGQSADGIARRAVRQNTADQSRDGDGKPLKKYRRTEKTNRAASAVKLYRLRTRWGRIPSAVNVGEN